MMFIDGVLPPKKTLVLHLICTHFNMMTCIRSYVMD